MYFSQQAGLGLTPVFKCTSTMCYGSDGTAYPSPGTDTLFHSLQTAINRWAGSAGFAPIGVDGKLGAGTLAAYIKAVKAAASSGAVDTTTLGILGAGATSIQALAATAQNATDGLNAIANNVNMPAAKPPAASPPRIVSTPIGPITLPPSISSVGGGSGIAASLVNSLKGNWLYYSAGGIAAIGLIWIVAIEMKRSKRKGSTASKPAAKPALKPSGAVAGHRRRRKRR